MPSVDIIYIITTEIRKTSREYEIENLPENH